MTTALVVLIFLVLFAVVLLLVSLGFRFLEAQRRKNLVGVLKTAAGELAPAETRILLDDSPTGEPAGLAILSRFPFYRLLETPLRQSGLGWSPGAVLAAMTIGVFLGVFLGSRVRIPVFRECSMAAGACLFGALPYFYVLAKRRWRLAQFEEQFPETLDFLARAMRAGHAFSVSLEMMAEESPEPMGAEFRKVFHEQNLGAPIGVALSNLAERVPLLDVRFFVSAVLLQRETGGNLAEILTKLSDVIRERFRLKGQVRAASAHGRATALILTILPVATILLLMYTAPEYLESMVKDPHGKYLIVAAIAGQVAGYFWMRRIINIKV